MAVITFDVAAFRAAYPQFTDITDGQLENFWNVACLISKYACLPSLYALPARRRSRGHSGKCHRRFRLHGVCRYPIYAGQLVVSTDQVRCGVLDGDGSLQDRRNVLCLQALLKT